MNHTDEAKAKEEEEGEQEDSGKSKSKVPEKEKQAEKKDVKEEKPAEGDAAESSKAAQDRAKAAEAAKSTTSTSSASASSSTSSAAAGNNVPISTGKEIAKVNVPEVFPQVLALPITLRPLFPTFYKAVTITHPPVIKAIRELLAHGQPYIGAFLFKDSESDADVITSLDQVHPVGVFAQITSTFEPPEKAKTLGKDGRDEKPEPKALTVVLYPHRRIRIDELVSSSQHGQSVPMARVVEEVQRDQTDEGEVSSFERDVPSVDSVREELGTAPHEPSEGEKPYPFLLTAEPVEEAPKKPLSQIGFLHSFLPDVSLTNVSNFQIEPYKKDTQMIRALMAELISSFKDLAQIAPMFRDQSA